LRDQSVNVHKVTSIEAAAPFAFNRLEPKFRRLSLALDVHVPWFSPVIRVKEKAISALTENRRHLTSLLDELCDAKLLSTIQHPESSTLAQIADLY
jgi:hypothetical protein